MENKFKITGYRYDDLSGNSLYNLFNSENRITYILIVNADNKLAINNNFDEETIKNVYLAYIDYVSKNFIDFFQRKEKLSKVPKKYLEMYALSEGNNIDYFIEEAIKNIDIAKIVNESIRDDNCSEKLTKQSRLNEAEYALSKIRRLKR